MSIGSFFHTKFAAIPVLLRRPLHQRPLERLERSLSPGDTVEFRPYPKTDLAWMQSQLSHCQYGWAWEWSRPGATIPLESYADGIYVSSEGKNNHSSQKISQKITGDCLSLSHKMGNLLAERFKTKYQFYVVQGNFPNSVWDTHFYILAWPKAQDAAMLNQIDRNLGEIPPNALMIDPSYGLMDVKGPHMQQTPLRDYYADQSIRNLTKLRPLPQKLKGKYPFLSYLENDRTAPEGCPSTIAIPFGFMRELMPPTNPDWNQSNALALLRFQKQAVGKAPKLLIGIFDSANEAQPITVYPDWRNEFTKNSQLYNTLAQMERRLNNKLPKLISQLRTHFINQANHTSTTQKETATAVPFHSDASPDGLAHHSFRDRIALKLKRTLQKFDEPAEPGERPRW